jgi:glucose/mannose transport system permease protein
MARHVTTTTIASQGRRRRFQANAIIGTIPMILVSVGVFVIGIGFSVLSLKLFPN